MIQIDEAEDFLILGQEGGAWKEVSFQKWIAIEEILLAMQISSYEAVVSETRAQV